MDINILLLTNEIDPNEPRLGHPRQNKYQRIVADFQK